MKMSVKKAKKKCFKCTMCFILNNGTLTKSIRVIQKQLMTLVLIWK